MHSPSPTGCLERARLHVRLRRWSKYKGPGAARRAIKDFWQRGRRGWADRDTWSFDTYLAELLAGALRHLAEHSHGHPIGLTTEGWLAILSEMADGFEAWAHLYNLADADEERAAYRKLQRSVRLLHRWFGHLWD